jgi:septal ring factor EnvC (AmiA/AmiB activator)
MKLVISLAVTTLLLTGCLKTRNDVRETEQRQVMQQQVVTLQKTNADSGNRFADLEEEVRSLNGRVDVVENRLGKSDVGVESALKSSQQQNSELGQKVMALQEALTKMEKDIYALNAEHHA